MLKKCCKPYQPTLIERLLCKYLGHTKPIEWRDIQGKLTNIQCKRCHGYKSIEEIVEFGKRILGKT